MEKKKLKLKFCMYCGALLPNYDKAKKNYCTYCGMKLPYKTEYQIQKASN